MLLAVFERTREFGLLRAVGWTRRRTVSLLLGESMALAVVGTVIGVGLSFAVARPSPGYRRSGECCTQISPRGLLACRVHRVGMMLLGPSTRQCGLRSCRRSGPQQ